MNRLIEYFVSRPHIANLIYIIVMIGGLMTLTTIQYEIAPKVDIGIVSIMTVHSQAGPEDIELSITIPIEEEVLKVDGLEKVNSQSMEGFSLIAIQLAPDLSEQAKAKALADVQKAVDRAKGKLPENLIEDPEVDILNTVTAPIMEVHVTGSVPEAMLRSTARQLEDTLRQVPGVAGIDKTGFRRKEIRIFLDLGVLHNLGLTFNEIKTAIDRRNVRESGGSLSSFRTEKKILSIGQFETPEEVGEVIVRQSEPGNEVRLRDIAQVMPDYEDWQIQSRVNGRLSIALIVKKKSNANELDVSDAVRTAVDQAEKALPAGVELFIVNDITRIVRSLLVMLVNNAALGFLFVFIVLFLFINLKQAIWVSLGLPFSILLTIVLLGFFGYSLTLMSLLAMILMVGMLVDDAVVTGESIQRQLETGLSPYNAAIKGTIVISAPVFVSTITTVLAFLPLAFLGGVEGKFVAVLPTVVAMLLGASLFESKFLLPTHLAYGKKHKVKTPACLQRMEKWYCTLLSYLLNHRYLTILAFVVIFVAILGFGAAVLKFELFPDPEFDLFYIKVEMTEGIPIDEMAKATDNLAEFVREQIPGDDLVHVVTKIGHHDIGSLGVTEGRNQSWALLSFFLKPEGERVSSSRILIQKLREKVKTLPQFESITVEGAQETTVIGKPVELELVGNDDTKLEIADQIISFLRNHPGTTEVWDSYRPGKDIIDLIFNHSVLASHKLSVSDVTQAIAVALDGIIIGSQQTLDERVYFRLQLPPRFAGRLDTLENLTVINIASDAIFLKDIAKFRIRPGDADIKHYFGRRTVTVYADIDHDKTDVASINADLATYIDEQKWESRFPDLRFVFSGQLEQQQQALGNIVVAFIFSLLAVFLVMVMLFNSYSQPFLVLLAIPFGLSGVVIGFGLQRLPISFLALTGAIGLVGVLVNDSVVMLDTVNNHRNRKGCRLTPEEVATAAKLRYRPIVITSITTAAGLFPAAYGIAGSNALIMPMIMAMAWGIPFGTFASLVLLPCLYYINEDIAQWINRFAQFRQKNIVKTMTKRIRA